MGKPTRKDAQKPPGRYQIWAAGDEQGARADGEPADWADDPGDALALALAYVGEHSPEYPVTVWDAQTELTVLRVEPDGNYRWV